VIGFVLFSVRRAWQGFWRNGLMSLAATATMVLMLLLLAGFWAIQSFLVASLDAVEHNFEVRAYLYPNVTQNQVDTLVAQLDAMPETLEVEHVTREEALERFRQAQLAQGRDDLTRYLSSNPLRASIEIKLTDPEDLDAVTAVLQDAPEIDAVQNVEALVDRLVSVTTILQTAGTVVLIAVALIVLFIIVNSIRLAVVARAEEIEVMRLVGASDAFIRWPFVFEGAFIGVLGAVVALGVLMAAAEPIGGFMVGFFEVLPIALGSVARDIAVLVLGAGLGLGVLGSWVSVRTYLLR
jgi:cell division transport system permease protein